MKTLIYKRTHKGDPDPDTGVFGCHDCMRHVRARAFDAVIGIGGTRPWPGSAGIARKLTWIGIGPHKSGDPKQPRVTFDHFLCYDESGPPLEQIAPALAKHMYEKRARVLFGTISQQEQQEIDTLLGLARTAPPSKGPQAATQPKPRPAGYKCACAS
jgi:hypothetical protein